MSYMNELPFWVSVVSALLTPMIAFLAVVLSFFNYWLDVRRRRDELFDRRYEFYQRLRSMWLRTGALPEQLPELDTFDIPDLAPIAEEAEFLFGKDIVKHVFSLAGRSHSGDPSFPEDTYVAPFRKYLAPGARR